MNKTDNEIIEEVVDNNEETEIVEIKDERTLKQKIVDAGTKIKESKAAKIVGKVALIGAGVVTGIIIAKKGSSNDDLDDSDDIIDLDNGDVEVVDF